MKTPAPLTQLPFHLLCLRWFASVSCAASLAFARVLAFATCVAGLAAALALTVVLAFARVFSLFRVSHCLEGDAGIARGARGIGTHRDRPG